MGMKSWFESFLGRLRKKKIVETLAAFIGGGWLLVEVVERLLVGHYKLPKEIIDLTVVSVVGALMATLVGRWFRSAESRPGNVKVEVLLVPLIMLATAALDLTIALPIAGLPNRSLPMAIAAFLLGIAWVVFKSLQWAALNQSPATVQNAGQGAGSGREKEPSAQATAAEPVTIRSLVVLPLANLSRDSEQEYFADGMTEELITSLAHLAELRVISRTSSMHFKGTKKTAPEIARQLNVDGIIEGTVRRAGERVRITAQLIHAPTDRHLWAESYERDLSDVLALQSDVARAIAGEIRLKLTPREQERLATTRKVVPEAYDLYLRGVREYERFTSDGFAKGVEYFEKSMQIDPDFALSHSALASCYVWTTSFRLAPPKTVIPKVKAAVAKALLIDPTLAEAHASMAITRWAYDWDWSGAETEFKRSIELNPNSAVARQHYAQFLMTMSRFDEAITEAMAGRDVDPASFSSAYTLAQAYLWAGRYDEAIRACQRALELDPENALTLGFLLAHASTGAGRIPEANAAADRAARSSLPGEDLLVDALLADVYLRLGRPNDAKRLQELWQSRATQRFVDAGIMPCFYIMLGKMDLAFKWMYRGIEERSPQCPWYNTSPARPSPEQRQDPRWSDVLRRIGFRPRGAQ